MSLAEKLIKTLGPQAAKQWIAEKMEGEKK